MLFLKQKQSDCKVFLPLMLSMLKFETVNQINKESQFYKHRHLLQGLLLNHIFGPYKCHCGFCIQNPAMPCSVWRFEF